MQSVRSAVAWMGSGRRAHEDDGFVGQVLGHTGGETLSCDGKRFRRNLKYPTSTR
jgi:hypothetical protein